MANIDWDATGSMLQGLGAIFGSVAIVFAAVIGGSTFQSWKRQQLLQRKIPLAEQILKACFEASERIKEVRSPIIFSDEIEYARKTLLENGIDVKNLEEKAGKRLLNSQAHHNRINKYSDTWIEIQSSKAAAYAHFDICVVNDLNNLISVVHQMRVYSDALADDDGQDREHTRRIYSTISSSRLKNEPDEIGEKVDCAVSSVELALKPILTESSGETQRAILDLAKSALSHQISLTIPWPLSRLLP